MASDGRTSTRHRLPPWLVASASGVLGIVVFLGGLYGFYATAYAGSVLPNVTVGQIAAAGLDRGELTAILERSTKRLATDGFTVTVAEELVTVDPARFQLEYDVPTTVTQALEVGHSGMLWDDMTAQVGALLTPSSLPVAYAYDEEALNQFIQDLATEYDTPEEAVAVSYEKTIAIHPPTAGQRFNQDALRATILTAFDTVTAPDNAQFPLATMVPSVTQAAAEVLLPEVTRTLVAPLVLTHDQGKFTVEQDQLAAWLVFEPAARQATNSLDGFYQHSSKVSLGIDEAAVQAYVKTVAQEVNQAAVDAKLTIKNGKATVFTQSQDGLLLDEVAAVAAIMDSLEDRRVGTSTINSLELPITKSKAAVTSSTVDQLGITELIGTATTDFSGSPSNRIHNITNGTKYLNGWLVKPGEEFSTVKAIGAVDSSTGYLPELVIKENRTIPEYGGGLCQVSTTLFRAVLAAGLPVTERRQHSYRVSYYEKDGDGRTIGPGLDATIYLPKPDFKFKNDSPGWLLVQGAVSGVRVTFEIYGTSDGRESSIDGPHTLSTTPAPETVYEETDQLAAGEEKQIEKPHAGATTVATYTVRRGGEVIHQQSFQSKYKALPARFLRGRATDSQQSATGESTPSEVAGNEQDVSTSSQSEEPVN